MTTTCALDDCLQRLPQADGVLVQVAETRGSAPREPGAWMVVWPDALTGTIGGGNLEFDAVAQARAMLRGQAGAPAHGGVRLRHDLDQGVFLRAPCRGHRRNEGLHSPLRHCQRGDLHRRPTVGR